MADFTPMMRQYMEVKQQYMDAVLFYRLGDFYEMFFDDALLASKELEITLTGRNCGQEERAPMCGVPYHSADAYIARLINKGYQVAICEQMENPEDANGLVRRDVIRVVSPGTVLDANVLDEKKNNYLCCVYKDEEGAGAAFVDVTTGEMFTQSFAGGEFLFKLYNELARYNPSEILINESAAGEKQFVEFIEERFHLKPYSWPDGIYDLKQAQQRLLDHFHLESLDTLGLYEQPYCVRSCGALFEVLAQTQKISMDHITDIAVYAEGQYMDIDINTRRNLEITETLREKSKAGSLLSVLDRTNTAMGARLLRKWLEQPLLNCAHIQQRLNAVNEVFENTILREELARQLKGILDIERLMSRIIYKSANARDLIALKTSAALLPEIAKLLQDCKSQLLAEQYKSLDTLEDLHYQINFAIVDDPPFSVREGDIIKDGYDEQVDRYRRAITDGKGWLAELEQTEREKTGIKNLKVGFNKVFGYYIEVTKSNLDQVPPYYVRKQTLANCERFITDELKKLEDTILSANERITTLEYNLFEELREKIAQNIGRIQSTVRAISVVDCIGSLAETAVKNNYVMPQINLSDKIVIKDGRHPVVESTQRAVMFVPNDTTLDRGDNRLAIITGPNMAGKSTYMRQVALIALMAQVGSFVPASSAQIGVVDKIFTRVGASDDIASGRSTFMVEMSEVAYIMKNATPKSLLILDEIGRGTSTFDGLSIAWAVIEHVADKKQMGAKTLFATHYHELTELENTLDGVKNYCIAVKKRGDDVIFLRKIIRGGADDSFGIEVAHLAGVPGCIIKRAKKIMAMLEGGDAVQTRKYQKAEEPELQTGLFDLGGSEVLDEIRKVDFSTITPIEALNKLYEMQQKLQ